MAQLSQPAEPFGEVNVHKQPDGSIDVVATILMVPEIEGARAGLALDASVSMKKMYGLSPMVSSVFGGGGTAHPNLVEPVTRTMAAYLSNFSSDSRCEVVYWACNPDGSAVEPLAAVTAADAGTLAVTGPKKHPWGKGTKLLPPVKHFVEAAFKDAPWAICVFVTDGVIDDLDAVKAYCRTFAQEIATGRRAFIKLVLIGIGEEVNERQMEELDDMFEGSGLVDPKGNDIDLWDHKLASEMKKVEEIFAEVVSQNTIVAASASVRNQADALCKDYSNGLPAILRFKLPKGSTSFTLSYPGGSVTQDITEGLTRA